MPNAKPSSWRDVLPVHPAADMFDLISADESNALGKDIQKNGLTSPIVLIAYEGKAAVVDGRNRLDAMERIGRKLINERGELRLDYFKEQKHLPDDADPYAYVISANIHRRHLTVEQKRELIIKLLKATPERSNRQVAETVKASHVTVGAVRAKLESTGQIDQLKKTVGKDGKARQQPAFKPRPERHVCWQCGTRAPIGEVERHTYADTYGDEDIWLHPGCVADFERKEKSCADDNPEPSCDEFGPTSEGEVARLNARIEQTQSVVEQATNLICSAWRRASENERQQFAEAYGCVVGERFREGRRGPDAPISDRIYEMCEWIEVNLDDLNKISDPEQRAERDDIWAQYEDIAYQLEELRDRADDLSFAVFPEEEPPDTARTATTIAERAPGAEPPPPDPDPYPDIPPCIDRRRKPASAEPPAPAAANANANAGGRS